ncbi:MULTISPECIES: EI24 domain-containing protein [Micromonospora]|uniref:CysZ protein n=1 Tax=Micromonospora yangpuensis TaxID=683228 RepID=A0A1C6VC82_9ACTN|nr:EI24 domain-containing protein [Micromonospora yangpuensis]GGM13035.1 membrane protein [Micromonospora yangpuensis]SCL64001.1 CysZ protein [Micromonospora yangpuensis]
MNAPRITAPVTGAVGRFFAGAGLLLRGLGLYVRSPGLMLLGVIPALITAVLFGLAFFALIYFVDDWTAAVTPFADDWSATARRLTRVIAGLALLGLAGMVGVLGFTAVTLVVGDPFYEKISERVEQRCGGTPDAVEVPFWASLRRSTADSLRLLAISVPIGIALFAAGFIPVLGQTVVPVVGATIGGWLLATELVGAPFYRRGKGLAQRRAALKADRPTALGFGVAVFLCFLIPLGAVLIMPAAVAGAALLARRSLGQPTVLSRGGQRSVEPS